MKRAHKYSAKRTVVDGIAFASKREATRYGELKLLERAGHIRGLRLQPRYALSPIRLEQRALRDINLGMMEVSRVPVAHYVADFEYEAIGIGKPPSWSLVIEDCKGFKTETYRLKKRWFEAQYGIQIREV